MAFVDASSGQMVLTLVYDGPALAGKTSSLRHLAQILGQEVSEWDGEEGRTLYCDWARYEGGRFDGRPIRCRIFTVPGQMRWIARRDRLLGLADAIIFVVDSSLGDDPETRKSLELLALIRSELDPAPPVLIQANKQDHPAARSVESLRELWAPITGDWPWRPTSAVRGQGLRELFILGVGRALEHARILKERGRLSIRPDELPDFAAVQGMFLRT